MSSMYPDEASDLLKDVLDLSRKELFAHPVQESVLTSAIDYITLGWTRMLQAVLDLTPANRIDELMPRYG